MAEEEAFLERWSRRKAATREAEAAEDETALAALSEEDPSAPPTPEAADQDAADEIDLESLPDPDEMDENADFSIFMRAGVPQALRTKALRRLWRLDPAFAGLDGLVDYGEDFTDAATVVPNLKSAWEAGKGYARKFAAEDEAASEAADAADADAEDKAAAQEDPTNPDAPEPQAARPSAPEDATET